MPECPFKPMGNHGDFGGCRSSCMAFYERDNEKRCIRLHGLPTDWEKEAEQLQVQLAGCGVAALGGTDNPARKSDYGWSQSYQDVLDLRLKYDQLKRVTRMPKGLIYDIVQSVNATGNAKDAMAMLKERGFDAEE